MYYVMTPYKIHFYTYTEMFIVKIPQHWRLSFGIGSIVLLLEESGARKFRMYWPFALAECKMLKIPVFGWWIRYTDQWVYLSVILLKINIPKEGNPVGGLTVSRAWYPGSSPGTVVTNLRFPELWTQISGSVCDISLGLILCSRTSHTDTSVCAPDVTRTMCAIIADSLVKKAFRIAVMWKYFMVYLFVQRNS